MEAYRARKEERIKQKKDKMAAVVVDKHNSLLLQETDTTDTTYQMPTPQNSSSYWKKSEIKKTSFKPIILFLLPAYKIRKRKKEVNYYADNAI